MRTLRQIIVGLALPAVLTFGAAAQDGTPSFEQAQYEACLALIDRNPEAAYEEGLAWRAQGGSWPALHCIALAQFQLGQHGIAARRLESTAEGAVVATDATRAIILGQAGDAWIAAREYAFAERAFRRGRDFNAGDPGLALGVAEAAALQEKWSEAESAANAALQLDSSMVRAWRVRAQARFELGNLDGAADDLAEALGRDNEDIDALVLRGRLNEARRIGGR